MNRCHSWLIAIVSAGVGCAPTVTVVNEPLLRRGPAIAAALPGSLPSWNAIGKAQEKAVKDARLLIIGPKAFQGALAAYVAHKSELLPTEFVTLETAVTSSTGVDDAEKLKRYIYDRWRKDSVGYVLLVGDCSIMPVRYQAVYCGPGEAKWGHYYFLACDLYYGDVAKHDGSFEDWNANKEGIHAQLFGELGKPEDPKSPVNVDQMNYLPQIAVGRWPVQNVSQVNLLVAKTIRYEKHVLADDLPTARRAGLVCCAGLADARGYMDDWGRKLEAASGWQPIKLYYADDKRNDRTPPPDEKGVEATLRSGVGILFHWGHGSETSWAGCLDVQRLPYLRDAAMPPVMFSMGCETARCAPFVPAAPYLDVKGKVHPGEAKGEKFTEPPPLPAIYQPPQFYRSGLGIELMRHANNGAVAYIGGNMVAQDSYAGQLLEGFVLHLAETAQPRFGDCWKASLTRYYHRNHLDDQHKERTWHNDVCFQQPMKFNLFGDPSLRLPRELDSKREFVYLDLQPLANQRLDVSADTPGNDLGTLRQGEQAIGGVRYQIGKQFILLGSKKREDKPFKVEGIKVGAHFHKLYVLHSVQNGAKVGNSVGSYTVQYANGTSASIPLAYGRDFSDWWVGENSVEPSRAFIAWTGDNKVAKDSGRRVRLFEMVWTNPHPEDEVTAIDFASAKSTATPFCVAMTIEK
jgi:hypothetical protein